MVSGKNAESAGIDRQALVNPVFCGEIGDRAFWRQFGDGRVKRRGHFLVKLGKRTVVQRHIGRVARHVFKAAVIDVFNDCHGIVPGKFPEARIKKHKQRNVLRVPGPPQVLCEFTETRQLFWQLDCAGEAVQKGRG